MPPKDDNGWGEWSKYVLKELERLNDQLEKMYDKLESQGNKLNTDITLLKVEGAKQGAIWGFVAGAVPVVIGIILHFMKSGN